MSRFYLVILISLLSFSALFLPHTALSEEDGGWKAKDAAYWKSVLSAEQVAVCREGGTERPFSGEYNKYKEPGVYQCSSCGLPLFAAQDKYDSGTGWPSFIRPIAPEAVEQLRDDSYGMVRTEVRCSRCGAHLGHVFNDGPAPTFKRYCINSVCLKHSPSSK